MMEKNKASPIPRLLFVLLLFVASLIGCELFGEDDELSYKVHGLNFSPFLEGQDPNQQPEISEAQLTERMAVIAPYTHWIRTFGSTQGLEKAGLVAHEMGLRAAVGAWLSRDLQANERELANLISAAEAGHVDLAIVGSEVLLREDLTEEQLIQYLNRVKEAIPDTIPVTTADVCDLLLDHPVVVSAVDLVFVNHYPYWSGIKLDCAMAALDGCHQRLTAAAGGKPVVVSETGWPSCGDTIGDAEPSPENASRYFLNFISWARANQVDAFYFEAFDEQWKAQYEGPQGACWGTWDQDGTLKPGMEAVFRGKTIPDNWSETKVPDGPGAPEIEFTVVPEFGSFDNLKGRVLHVRPTDFKVAVYIYVSGWWTKPFFNRPLTTIDCEGSFTTDITTGGIDQRATRIAAFLVPNGYNPPLSGGRRTLPPELDENAVAKVEVTRTP